ncbi:MAG: AAA domain-containing protein [Phycisphaera sp.]|nr:AAA domain-containing protein [Phycisphaera sp.]
MQRTVLILEPAGIDLSDLRDALSDAAEGRCGVTCVSSEAEMTRRLGDADRLFAVIVHSERGDGKTDGLTMVRRIHALSRQRHTTPSPVVVVAEHGDVASAAAAIAAGATDFLVLGGQLTQRVTTLMGKLHGLFDMLERTASLDRANASLREAVEPQFRIVGRSPAVKKLIDTITRVATVPRPVLIVGERGTGKELVARAIHDAGGDPTRPIVVVNCAAFSDALLESELFGHERGAFTGADEMRRGKFEQANGGTLFLDEIGHMSTSFQQKILRVVEYGTFHRVGGHTDLTTRCRVIAATNVDLKAKIKRGEFLSDLYDRLSFEVVEAPPLRRRKADVAPLAQHFLEQFAREIPTFAGKVLSDAAIDMLRKYDFPGNVRELKNIIERAAYRDTTNEITPEDIGMLAAERVMAKGTFTEKVDEFSRRLIQDAMTQSGGNQAEAARSLGLTYHQFRHYLKKYT